MRKSAAGVGRVVRWMVGGWEEGGSGGRRMMWVWDMVVVVVAGGDVGDGAVRCPFDVDQ